MKQIDLYTDLDKMRAEKPFKAIIPGFLPERFASMDTAKDFFKDHDGTCLLAFDDGKKYKILDYKYVCHQAIKLSA